MLPVQQWPPLRSLLSAGRAKDAIHKGHAPGKSPPRTKRRDKKCERKKQETGHVRTGAAGPHNAECHLQKRLLKEHGGSSVTKKKEIYKRGSAGAMRAGVKSNMKSTEYHNKSSAQCARLCAPRAAFRQPEAVGFQ